MHHPHRIARVNYLPRVLGFLAIFIAILLLGRERDFGVGTLSGAAVSFLIYPQLAWLIARLRQDSKRAELQHLLFDSALLGAWAGGLGFNVWITFSLLAPSLLSNAVSGGLARLGQAAVCFAAGGVMSFVVFAPGFLPSTSPLVTTFLLGISLLYLLSVGVTQYWQNRLLAQAHKDIGRKNRIFRALLQMGLLAHEAEDVQTLMRKTLEQLRKIFPGEAYGLVLFHPERHRLLRHMGFLGLGAADQRRVLAELTAYNGSDQCRLSGEVSAERGALRVIPLHQHLSQSNGYLILGAGILDEERESILPLFVNQLGAALENKLLTRKLRRAAETDGLTGLFNRRYLEARHEEAIEWKQEYPDFDFAIIMIDMIGLKQTNDAYGHQVGDALIRAVADRLARHTRDSDVVARFGGDEFVVLCHDCGEEQVGHAAKRLISAARSEGFRVDLSGDEVLTLEIRLSVGVAGSDEHPAEKVMQVADRRMYENKAAWYNRNHTSREGRG